MEEIKYLPAVIEREPEILDLCELLHSVLSKVKKIDYARKHNIETYKRIEKETDTEIRELLRSKIQQPDIEGVAIYASMELVSILDKMGYGIMSQGDDFYVYDGYYWRVVERLQMKHFITEFLKKTGVKKSMAENASTIDRYVRQFCYSLYAPDNIKAKKVARINTLNVTVVIDAAKGTVEERTHDKEDKIFYVLPYKYDGCARCPLFHKFLDEVIPGDIQDVVQEFFGTCLIPSIKIEKILCCVGTGANGKSVLFAVISYVLGSENVTTYNINSLCDERSTTRRGIEHKLLNYSSDFSGKIWNNGFFKQLASGEPVEAKSLYHDPVIITDYARLAYNSNFMPESSDTSSGFRRRLLIVEFNKTIEKDKRDPYLSDKLCKEAPGILNWMIEGLVRFIKNGNKFSNSSVLNASIDQYQQSTDSVTMFLDGEGYSPGTSPIRLTELHNRYKQYCQNAGIKQEIGFQDFKMRIGSMGYHIKEANKKAIMVYVDIISKSLIDSPFFPPK